MSECEWRDIETAPKDGRLVDLGWIANGMLELRRVARWQKGQWTGGWTPTHWRPWTGEGQKEAADV